MATLVLKSMALPTNGRVIIETTSGEIDMELWSKVLCQCRSKSQR